MNCWYRQCEICHVLHCVGPERDQNPATIKRTAHPETGEMYTMVDLKKRNREPEQAGATALYQVMPTSILVLASITHSMDVLSISQDPSTIQHQEGPSGELYAMPQKTGKKKKKEEAEAEAEVEEMSEEQKAALYSVPDRKGQKSKSEGVSSFTPILFVQKEELVCGTF